MRLDSRLRSALQWWREFLSSAPLSHLPWRDRGLSHADLVLYTDAESTGQIGVVLTCISSGQSLYIQDRVPQRLRDNLLPRKTQINLYELAAILCAVHTLLPRMEGRRLVAFVDNQAALSMLVKGWSPKVDANAMVFTIWMALAQAAVSTHWRYVPSKMNIADGPSRDDLKHLKKLGAKRVASAWPDELGW